MAEITNFKVNRNAARQLMKHPAVKADLMARGERIRAAAEGMSESGAAEYEAVAKDLTVSSHVFVQTANPAAMRSNAKHNSLVRSIDAGRG